jgi:hypothetical protein
MNNAFSITPDEALDLPASVLSQYPPETLFRLKNHAADLITVGKALLEHIEHSMDFRWGERAQQMRHQAGKDTGVIHFEDGNVRVTADLPKKVDWDQARLADIIRRIAESGDDPREYVEITYRVSETRFNAWPETLKSAFIDARTLRTGKPSYRLALMSEVQS